MISFYRILIKIYSVFLADFTSLKWIAMVVDK